MPSVSFVGVAGEGVHIHIESNRNENDMIRCDINFRSPETNRLGFYNKLFSGISITVEYFEYNIINNICLSCG